MLYIGKQHKVVQKVAIITVLFFLSNFIGLEIIRAQPPPDTINNEEPFSRSTHQKPSDNHRAIFQLMSEIQKDKNFLTFSILVKGKKFESKKFELNKSAVESKFSFFHSALVFLPHNLFKYTNHIQLFSQIHCKNFPFKERSPPYIHST